MSTVYWHSPSDTAELWGVERHNAARMCVDVTVAALAPDRHESPENPDPLRLVARLPEWARTDRNRFDEHIRMLVSDLGYTGSPSFAGPNGDVSGFVLSLNTAQVMGSDPVRLMARLHGQCEMHAYVEGPNRAWMAGIIEEGLGSGILREEVAGHPTGWRAVVALLRLRDDEPVVTSYSVTDSFPSLGHVREWVGGPDDEEEWYAMEDRERWELGMAALRKDIGYTCEMRQEDDEHGLGAWHTYRYGCGTNAFDLRKHALGLREGKTSAVPNAPR